MKWSLAAFLAVVACSEASVLLSNENVLLREESVCPPPDQISPCICSKESKDPQNRDRISARCSNFTEAGDLADIFTKNPNWNLQNVEIDGAVMEYIPALMLEKAVFQNLVVVHSTLVTLFDRTPVTTTDLSLHMFDVKVLRGFQWSSIAHANLLELGAVDTDIKNFGLDFKENIPINVQRLFFDNTKTSRITHQAFENLKNLAVLAISRGSIKVISRDMFPRPSSFISLDLSFHKIDVLPEDIFADMPGLGIFKFEGNLLKTLPEKAFFKSNVLFNFVGNQLNCNCDLKWITIPGKINPKFFAGECVEPESFKGKQLASIKQSDFSFCV